MATSIRLDLGIQTRNPSEIPEMSKSSLDMLFGDGAEEWSAVRISSGGHSVVVFNPLQSAGKRRSAITHELAHILLLHTPSTWMFAPDATWTLQAYGLREEVEADWLTGCLLLPTPLADRMAEMYQPEIMSALNGVTPELLRYRLRITGALQRSQMTRKRVRSLLHDPPNWD